MNNATHISHTSHTTHTHNTHNTHTHARLCCCGLYEDHAQTVRGHDEIVPRTKEPTAFKWPFGAMFGLLSRTLGTIRHTTVKTRLEKA